MDESKFDIDEKHGKWHPKKRRIACCSSINQPVINTVMALEALFIATIDRDFKKIIFSSKLYEKPVYEQGVKGPK